MTQIESFYHSFYQQPLLLALPSILWLMMLLLRMQRRDRVWGYCVTFTALSIADAFLTANDVLGFGALPGTAATLVSTFFVILGDFRVFVWNTGEVRAKWLRCIGLSLVVPAISVGLRSQLPAAWGANPRILYLVYELVFLAFFGGFTVWTSGRARGLLSPYCSYVLGYYALWALADIWILASASASSAAWGLRIVANMMYYVGWSPWVYVNFRRAHMRERSDAAGCARIKAAAFG